VPERELQGVIAAMLDAHPYEEVAYDLYPLRNPGIVYGRGRIGELPLKVSLDTVLAQVNDALGLNVEHQARCSHRPGLSIHSLAVASGTGTGESLLWAAHRQEAGAIVTGGASLTDLMLADSTATVLIDVGFAPSVAPGLQRLVAQLRDTFGAESTQVLYVP
jgi:putative NIF3 family GTP cyclohydrolase 1 type 2